MVIITVHAVTTFLLSKSSAWSRTCLCPKPTDSNQISQRLTDNCENFTVQLLECEDVQSLGAVVKTCLHNVVNNIASGALFYWEEAGRTLYTSDVTGTHVCSPCPECIRNVFRKGQHSVVDVSSIPDSILEHLNLSSSSTQNLKVGSYPVQDRKSGSVLAVLLVAGQHLGDATLCDLQVPLKQIAACYNHIQRTFQSPRNTEERVSQQLIKLCGDLCDQDAAQLQLKVLRYLEEETQAECSFLLMVVPETQELFCQVVGRRILPEEIRFPGPSSSFSTALESKQPITLEDIPKENIKGIEELVCCPLRSLLCVPVTSRADNNLIALACVINKLNANRFTDRDISTIRQCFRYTVTVLTSTLAFQNEHKLKVQTQALLQVARHLFTNLDDLTKLLREIMQQARNLTNAERCSVFLIDNDTDELVAKVFDGITTNKNNEVQEEIRLPISQGIAGKVATSGELLNIKDAYSHPLFYRGIDDTTGFRTRNILCFPIKDEKGRVLGVAQLCNKKNGPCFTQFDEEVATAFGIYCCISISHSLMYKKVIDSQMRSNLANELMMYHMKVSPDDVTGLSSCDIPHPRMIHPDFIQFSYAPRTLPEDRTLLACLSMFEDLNLLNRWRIKRETIARFILMVRKGYRNPPYHNWMHAYTVAQFCYQLIRNLKLENQLEEIEIFSLFVSCLCHDIDHRGTNNSFQTASKSVLAALYSSEGSVLERHHFAQTMCILNTEGCNVFENLSSKDYQTVLDLMRDIILATDLAHHFKIMKNLTELANKGYDRTVMKDRKHVLCLMMTACDLSDQTRPWDNTKRVAALIYKEFFSQGDMEKARGIQPHEMYDRDKAHIPAVQISFLDHVVLPAYRILARMFKPVEECAESVEQNKRHWERLSELIRVKRGGSTSCMTFEEVLAMEQEEIDTDHVVLNHALTNGEQS
ncbi:cGMP-dependent 3',5'-cyclic phosphodiesterase-like isoform X8 [Dreissena polymorpha]|uniref:cGMP-dependent 3',5'-cyclic phosphodiesterase-like isoform X8 n=1 Tax=Dreissena polymorpha TaxID=45954 RepID=UPI002265157E|nr:cGMP-dependent 3',5'-cyclic phosphodiesterase-like isoform X8 [Dreissena polymorpha]